MIFCASWGPFTLLLAPSFPYHLSPKYNSTLLYQRPLRQSRQRVNLRLLAQAHKQVPSLTVHRTLPVGGTTAFPGDTWTSQLQPVPPPPPPPSAGNAASPRGSLPDDDTVSLPRSNSNSAGASDALQTSNSRTYGCCAGSERRRRLLRGGGGACRTAKTKFQSLACSPPTAQKKTTNKQDDRSCQVFF